MFCFKIYVLLIIPVLRKLRKNTCSKTRKTYCAALCAKVRKKNICVKIKQILRKKICSFRGTPTWELSRAWSDLHLIIKIDKNEIYFHTKWSARRCPGPI